MTPNFALRRRDLFGMALVLPTSAISQGSGAAPGSPTLISEDRRFKIENPGAYRLTVDVHYGSSGWDPTGESRPSGSIADIFSGRVDLDLGGRTISSSNGMSGIYLNARDIRRTPKWVEGKPHPEPHEVRVHNGRLDFRGKRMQPPIVFCDRWEGVETRALAARGTPGHQGYRAPPPADLSYFDSAFQFEDLTLLADHVGLFVEGARTVIRRCVIESAGHAAILAAGPSILIEDCEIRLRAPKESGPGAYEDALRAAILLRDGSQAVIRNNRIRVDAGGPNFDTRCIAVRDGASDVLVQGNTFINVHGEPVSFMDGSSGTVVDNKRETKGWPF